MKLFDKPVVTTDSDHTHMDLIVLLTAKDLGNLPELRELLATQVNLSRKEPGCVRFEALQSESNPGTFIIVERWQSQAALDEHRKARAITTVYVPKILPLVDRALHECTVLPRT